MWNKVFLSFFVALAVECYPQRVSVIRTPNDHSSISGVNFIYFLGPSPTPYQMSAIKDITDNYLTEMGYTSNGNTLLNTPSLVHRRKLPDEHSGMKNDHSHSAIETSSFRRKRSADPTYKKAYKGGGGGGGGGCCNTCGQCGGGGSGSYSQSQSYSSSSSGSHSSGYGKK